MENSENQIPAAAEAITRKGGRKKKA